MSRYELIAESNTAPVSSGFTRRGGRVIVDLLIGVYGLTSGVIEIGARLEVSCSSSICPKDKNELA